MKDKGRKTQELELPYKPADDTSQPSLFDNQEGLLTIKELAKKLCCSVGYLKKLRSSGVIHPAVSVNRFVRYRYSEVVIALQKRSA